MVVQWMEAWNETARFLWVLVLRGRLGGRSHKLTF